jgi:hypothetical protein
VTRSGVTVRHRQLRSVAWTPGELARAGEARIIIPTLLHEECVDRHRQLSRQSNPTGLVDDRVRLFRCAGADRERETH